MTVIVDYGVGNLFSLRSSFAAIGTEVSFSSDPKAVASADKIILPGVGAFCDASKKLKESGMQDAVLEAAGRGTPLLGVCLGMQMLFDRSFENGEYEGLGLIKGDVIGLKDIIPEGLKIPQIGWNALKYEKDCKLFGRINEGDYVYFVHSYAAVGMGNALAATTEYGATVTAAVCKDNIYGCQFHPEKSGEVGLNILRAFCEDI